MSNLSKASDAYDNLLTLLGTVLLSTDGWLQIPNGFDIPSNASGFLRQGYGVAINGGVNDKLVLCSELSTNRKYTLSIAREVFKTDGDATGYGTVAKQLMDDLFVAISEFEENTTFRINYESDTGIQPIENGDFSGMYVSATISVQMIEDLN